MEFVNNKIINNNKKIILFAVQFYETVADYFPVAIAKNKE